MSVRSILQQDNRGGISGAHLEDQGAAATDRLVVLMRRQNEHRLSERRFNRHGPDKSGEVIRGGRERKHPAIDVAQSGVQKELKLFAATQ